MSYTRKAAEKVQTVDDALGIAINLARSNDLMTSLDYFERATQIEPQNSQLWSNMGVTYMRLGVRAVNYRRRVGLLASHFYLFKYSICSFVATNHLGSNILISLPSHDDSYTTWLTIIST